MAAAYGEEVAASQSDGTIYDRRRYFRIIYFFTYHFLEFVFYEFVLGYIIGAGLVERGRERRIMRAAIKFRRLAVDMGGVLIKLGQFVSTRVDVLPESVIHELEGLQDEVEAEDFAAIQHVLIEELGERLNDFEHIDIAPIAAASLGQVYRAVLDGHKVVIKVQRPRIRQMVATDLAALAVVARWSMRWKFIRRRANVPVLLEEFSAVLWEELDYIAEGNNARRFKRMFADNYGVYVPNIYPDYMTRRVLVMEDVTAIKINDYSALEAAGIDRTEVARRLLDTYLTQVFLERFFHADPHPGNIFIRPLADEEVVKLNGNLPATKGRPFYLIFVDYGMIGRLTPQLVETLRETFIAAGLRDARGLVECYDTLGLLMPDADRERIVTATKQVFDLTWNMSFDELAHLPPEELERFTRDFQDLLFQIPFRFPQNLIYLGRCAAILSGMAVGLDADFQPAAEMQPYVKFLMEGGALDDESPEMRQQVWDMLRQWLTVDNLNAVLTQKNINQVLATGSELLVKTAQLPILADEVLRKADRGELETRLKLDAELRAQLRRMEAQNRWMARAVMFSGVAISAAILLQGRDNSGKD